MDAAIYDRIVEKICEIYENAPEQLGTLLEFLDNDERRAGNREASSAWNMLKNLVNRQEPFLVYTERLLQNINANGYTEHNTVPENTSQEGETLGRDTDPNFDSNFTLNDSQNFTSNAPPSYESSQGTRAYPHFDIQNYLQVVNLASEIYRDNTEDMSLLFIFMECEAQNFEATGSAVNLDILKALTHDRIGFKVYGNVLINRIRVENGSTIFIESYVYQQRLRQDKIKTKNAFVAALDKNRNLTNAVVSGEAFLWAVIPLETKKQVVAAMVGLLQKNIFNGPFLEKLAVVAYNGRYISSVLMVIPLCYEVGRSVYLWYNERISGLRAVQNITKAATSTVGGAAGGAIGGAIGGVCFGPLGVIICSILGGAFGMYVTSKIANHLCDQIFNLPPTQALEDAYKYLGVEHKVSDTEVLIAYRRRLLIDHPDKPTGSHQAFCTLQSYITVIRVSRGEQFDNAQNVSPS